MKVGVMPRADTRKLRSAGEPDALKGASPVREGAVGNLRQPVVPVVRRHESQQGAGRLLHKKRRRRTTDYTDRTDKRRKVAMPTLHDPPDFLHLALLSVLSV